MKHSLPTLNSCDLFSNERNHSNLIVHCTDELFKNKVSIPNKPHRHSFYQILFIIEGKGNHIIDFENYPISNNSLFLIAPGQVHYLKLSNTSKGVLINFNKALFDTFLNKPEIIEEYPFFDSSGKYSFLKLSHHNKNIIDVFNRIKTSRFEVNLVRLYLLEIFILVNKEYIASEVKEFSSGERIMADFDLLLEENFDIEHYPKFYAENMAITPNYLNSICQKIRNKTAGDIIRDRILLEIKRLLVNSKLNVAEIAYLIGFDDNSYFSKFFKKHEGMTPSQFRKKL